MTTTRTHARWYGPRWQRLSAAFLARYPFCVLCLARGQVNEGASEFILERQRSLIVDHIIPHRGDLDLFWDQDNWQTLCRYPCHDVDKKRCEKRNGDWWELVRCEIEQHKALSHIDRHSNWLPSAIVSQVSK